MHLKGLENTSKHLELVRLIYNEFEGLWNILVKNRIYFWELECLFSCNSFVISCNNFWSNWVNKFLFVIVFYLLLPCCVFFFTLNMLVCLLMPYNLVSIVHHPTHQIFSVFDIINKLSRVFRVFTTICLVIQLRYGHQIIV